MHLMFVLKQHYSERKGSPQFDGLLLRLFFFLLDMVTKLKTDRNATKKRTVGFPIIFRVTS